MQDVSVSEGILTKGKQAFQKDQSVKAPVLVLQSLNWVWEFQRVILRQWHLLKLGTWQQCLNLAALHGCMTLNRS